MDKTVIMSKLETMKTEKNPRGAGRKPYGTESKTLRLSPRTIARLKERAEELKITQNLLADKILSVGLET